jgi:hypothetical protein
MSNVNLRSISNSFQDVRLVSLASWAKAAEISPRDRGGPYIVLQEGYDPADLAVTPDEFVLGRSGKWLSLAHFFRLSIPERRAEFVFGTAAEVMQMMSNLSAKPEMLDRAAKEAAKSDAAEGDEMAAALQAAKNRGGKTT